MEMATLVAMVLIFGGSIFGIFRTKTPGFGRYTTSVLILALVLFVASLAFVLGKVEWQHLANLLFCHSRFCGGSYYGETRSLGLS